MDGVLGRQVAILPPRLPPPGGAGQQEKYGMGTGAVGWVHGMGRGC